MKDFLLEHLKFSIISIINVFKIYLSTIIYLQQKFQESCIITESLKLFTKGTLQCTLKHIFCHVYFFRFTLINQQQFKNVTCTQKCRVLHVNTSNLQVVPPETYSLNSLCGYLHT